jgi:predicted PurR-regulated permease PerM
MTAQPSLRASPAAPTPATPHPASPDERPVAVLPGGVAASIHACALVLVTASLYFARDFFLPVALGFLFAMTLIPIVRWLARHGVPAGATALALVAMLAAALSIGVYSLSGPVSHWIAKAPQMGQQIEAKVEGLRGSVDAVAQATKRVEELSRSASDPAVQEVVIKDPGFLSTATSSLWSGVTTVGVALVLVLFLLASGDMLYEKIIRVLPTLSDKKRALRIVHDIEASISRYLLTVTLINVGLGVVIGLVMWALGMPSPAVWAVASVVLNFLPYIGAVVGVGVTAVVAFVHFDGLTTALLPPLAYLACTIVEGNVVTPLVLGRRLELNTVALFVGVAFWGFVWGIVGVFLAVPLLVVLKVFCDHFPGLSGLGEFLSSTPAHTDEEAEEKALNPVVKT